MDPEVQQILFALTTAARAGNAPGISAFLTTGAYSALNPNERALVDRTLGRTRFAGKPGDFYQTWRAQAQAQGQGQQGPNGAPAQPPAQVPAAATGGVRDNNSPGYPGNQTASPLPMNVPGQRPPNTTPPDPNGGANPFEGTPGMSATAGTAAGQAQQAAAQAAASAATAMAGNRGQGGGTGGGGGAPGAANDQNPGGFSAGQGQQLSQDDNMLLQFALRAAGFDPNVMTPAMKYAAKALQPLVQSRRAAYGAGDAGQNLGGLPQDIASFAKEYTTPGANFYGHAQQYAQGLLGGKSFQDFIAGLSDPQDQYNMYQALVPLLYGGANPMIQQSVSDQMRTQQNNYNYQDFQNQGQGQKSILDFIRNQPNLNPALRSIFGPQR